MSLLFGTGTKTCRYEKCLKPFVPSKFQTNRQRFCSVTCRANFNFKHNFYPKHRQPPAWLDRWCPGCGLRFKAEGRGKGKSLRKFCTRNCRSAHDMRKKREQRRRERELPKLQRPGA